MLSPEALLREYIIGTFLIRLNRIILESNFKNVKTNFPSSGITRLGIFFGEILRHWDEEILASHIALCDFFVWQIK